MSATANPAHKPATIETCSTCLLCGAAPGAECTSLGEHTWNQPMGYLVHALGLRDIPDTDPRKVRPVSAAVVKHE
jgi:hypothetical protein